jgi:class 3 adenylate cyclase
MHLDEHNYRRLLSGEEFPGAEELARHLEAPCADCEAFLGERRPESVLKPILLTGGLPAERAPAASRGTPARLPRSMRSENLALMLTDIKGYTDRTSRQTRAENERLLQIHAELMLPVFRAFDGVVRKSIGDAYLVTFSSPTNAVLCGLAIQDRLFTFNQTAPEPDRMQVRVVVNAGEVRAEPGDVFGEPMHVAKEVETLAEASEVTFTEAVFLVMNKAEVPSVELGLFELKGVAEKVRLFKVPRGGGRAMTGPGPAGASAALLPFGGLGLARAGNLPETDLATIERTLNARQSRRALVARAKLFARSPMGLRVGAGAGGALLLAGLAFGIHLWRVPPVERALSRGELAAAAALVEKMPAGPERTFWTARIEERKRRWTEAIDAYVDAAQRSPALVKPVIERLSEVAHAGDCSAKVRVADELGELGEASGRPVLEALSTEEPQKASGLGGIFGRGCDPAAHARKALDRLGGK